MSLYKFNKLRSLLDEWDFPQVASNDRYKLVREDFTQAYQNKQIEFRDNGIYFVKDGQEFKGYMYMPRYNITKYKHASRFHIAKCDVVKKFLDKGIFSAHYVFSNSETNDITDSTTQKVHKNEVLKMCSRCRVMIMDEIQTTEDFYNDLKDDEVQTDVEVDINGYVRNWSNISLKYRRSVEFTCEVCRWKPNSAFEKRFAHTHHLNQIKTDNRPKNLQCLCIKCHSEVDERHQKNFSHGRRKKELEAFLKKYSDSFD